MTSPDAKKNVELALFVLHVDDDLLWTFDIEHLKRIIIKKGCLGDKVVEPYQTLHVVLGDQTDNGEYIKKSGSQFRVTLPPDNEVTQNEDGSFQIDTWVAFSSDPNHQSFHKQVAVSDRYGYVEILENERERRMFTEQTRHRVTIVIKQWTDPKKPFFIAISPLVAELHRENNASDDSFFSYIHEFEVRKLKEARAAPLGATSIPSAPPSQVHRNHVHSGMRLGNGKGKMEHTLGIICEFYYDNPKNHFNYGRIWTKYGETNLNCATVHQGPPIHLGMFVSCRPSQRNEDISIVTELFAPPPLHFVCATPFTIKGCINMSTGFICEKKGISYYDHPQLGPVEIGPEITRQYSNVSLLDLDFTRTKTPMSLDYDKDRRQKVYAYWRASRAYEPTGNQPGPPIGFIRPPGKGKLDFEDEPPLKNHGKNYDRPESSTKPPKDFYNDCPPQRENNYFNNCPPPPSRSHCQSNNGYDNKYARDNMSSRSSFSRQSDRDSMMGSVGEGWRQQSYAPHSSAAPSRASMSHSSRSNSRKAVVTRWINAKKIYVVYLEDIRAAAFVPEQITRDKLSLGSILDVEYTSYDGSLKMTELIEFEITAILHVQKNPNRNREHGDEIEVEFRLDLSRRPVAKWEQFASLYGGYPIYVAQEKSIEFFLVDHHVIDASGQRKRRAELLNGYVGKSGGNNLYGYMRFMKASVPIGFLDGSDNLDSVTSWVWMLVEISGNRQVVETRDVNIDQDNLGPQRRQFEHEDDIARAKEFNRRRGEEGTRNSSRASSYATAQPAPSYNDRPGPSRSSYYTGNSGGSSGRSMTPHSENAVDLLEEARRALSSLVNQRRVMTVMEAEDIEGADALEAVYGKIRKFLGK